MPYNAEHATVFITALENSKYCELSGNIMKIIDTNNSILAKATYQKPVVIELTIQFTHGGMAGVFEFNVNGMAPNRKDQGTS